MRRTPGRDYRVFGFDSFEGLPVEAAWDDEGAWHPGRFDSDETRTRFLLTREGADWSKTFLIKGLFTDTLNGGLVERHHMEHRHG